MVLPGILLIDDNKVRIQQFEAILSFLEYAVKTVDSHNFQSQLSNPDNISAIFIGGGNDKQGALVKSVTEKVKDIPVFLLIEESALFQISSTIQKMITKVHKWPTTYVVFSEL